MKKINFTNISEKIKANGKKILKRTIAAAAVLSILGGSVVVYAEHKENQTEQKIYDRIREDAKTDGITLISEDEVKKIALDDAKAKETDVKYLEISLDDEQNNRYNDYDDNDNYDDDHDHDDHDNDDDDRDHEDYDHDDENHDERYIYEVDFIYDGMEYSYEIDAESKEILQRQYESWWN